MVTHVVLLSLENYLTVCVSVQDLPLIVDSATSLNQLLKADDTLQWDQGVEACKNLANTLRTGIYLLYNITYNVLTTSSTFKLRFVPHWVTLT